MKNWLRNLKECFKKVENVEAPAINATQFHEEIERLEEIIKNFEESSTDDQVLIGTMDQQIINYKNEIGRIHKEMMLYKRFYDLMYERRDQIPELFDEVYVESQNEPS